MYSPTKAKWTQWSFKVMYVTWSWQRWLSNQPLRRDVGGGGRADKNSCENRGVFSWQTVDVPLCVGAFEAKWCHTVLLSVNSEHWKACEICSDLLLPKCNSFSTRVVDRTVPTGVRPMVCLSLVFNRTPLFDLAWIWTCGPTNVERALYRCVHPQCRTSRCVLVSGAVDYFNIFINGAKVFKIQWC